MRVLFWGTPEFAAASLRALVGEGHDVVAVVTQPDRAVGRHHSRLVPSEVKQVAVEEGIHVLQPESARSPALVSELRALAPDISVVVAYGQILTREVIDLPARGTINVHASLLPLLRGAAPIQAALRQGMERTGVTIMQMVPRLDAGPIILQQDTPILSDETGGELEMRLSELGAMALIEALVLIALGRAETREQDESRATWAPRVTREDARVNWELSADEVARALRAYDPRPGAFTTARGSEVQLFGARIDAAAGGAPGQVLDVSEEGMLVACGRGAVRILQVHPSGRKRMSSADWFKGRGVAPGDVLGTTG